VISRKQILPDWEDIVEVIIGVTLHKLHAPPQRFQENVVASFVKLVQFYSLDSGWGRRSVQVELEFYELELQSVARDKEKPLDPPEIVPFFIRNMNRGRVRGLRRRVRCCMEFKSIVGAAEAQHILRNLISVYRLMIKSQNFRDD